MAEGRDTAWQPAMRSHSNGFHSSEDRGPNEGRRPIPDRGRCLVPAAAAEVLRTIRAFSVFCGHSCGHSNAALRILAQTPLSHTAGYRLRRTRTETVPATLQTSACRLLAVLDQESPGYRRGDGARQRLRSCPQLTHRRRWGGRVLPPQGVGRGWTTLRGTSWPPPRFRPLAR